MVEGLDHLTVYPPGYEMDKKGKKVVQTPPPRAFARLAELKALVSPTPPPASSTPAMPQPVMKKPIFINLTKNSESEEGSKEENPERKLTNTICEMIGLGKLGSSDSNPRFPSSTSSSSEEDDIIEDDPRFWELMILMIGEPQNHLIVLRQAAQDIHHQPIRSAPLHTYAQRTVHILSWGGLCRYQRHNWVQF
ncbi:hypothetical protein PIB30_058162 [Stylosanthes scabra]|uniref:Uncharacterized protein n=1 Tax=Stylosanthes scabra TaxID=79078 RepID=A0ABU6QK85_9FABA|nr:hypothetical protein [Stylosanthes scabra]